MIIEPDPTSSPSAPQHAAPDAAHAAGDAATDPVAAGAEPRCGLREQKKQRARAAMHRAALELVVEHGSGHVTAEDIAQRAQVSTRTFFNYWPTKEMAILGIDPDRNQELLDWLRERPVEEDVVVSLRGAIRRWLHGASPDAELRELKRRVVERDPNLQRLSSGVHFTLAAEIAELIEARLEGPDAADRAHVIVNLSIAAARAAFGVSMRNGTEIEHEYGRILAGLDDGTLRF